MDPNVNLMHVISAYVSASNKRVKVVMVSSWGIVHVQLSFPQGHNMLTSSIGSIPSCSIGSCSLSSCSLRSCFQVQWFHVVQALSSFWHISFVFVNWNSLATICYQQSAAAHGLRPGHLSAGADQQPIGSWRLSQQYDDYTDFCVVL